MDGCNCDQFQSCPECHTETLQDGWLAESFAEYEAEQGKIKTVEARPVAWEVQCPDCGQGVECTMNEGDDGATYTSGDFLGDPFVTCESCGAVIKPADMWVDTKKPPPALG